MRSAGARRNVPPPPVLVHCETLSFAGEGETASHASVRHDVGVDAAAPIDQLRDAMAVIARDDNGITTSIDTADDADMAAAASAMTALAPTCRPTIAARNARISTHVKHVPRCPARFKTMFMKRAHQSRLRPVGLPPM